MNEYEQAFRLDGRVALVTGGGSGIGRGCARVLASAGATVVVVGRRLEKLQAVCQEIRAAGNAADCFQADVTVESQCRAMVDCCVEQYGRLDILVNSAGTNGPHGTLDEEFDLDSFRRIMDTDFGSVVLAAKYAYPECARHGVGSILTIGSIAAIRAQGAGMAYTASKGALTSLTRKWSRTFGPMGIRVNVIHPGLILTEMTEGIRHNPALKEQWEKTSALGTLGEMDDIGCCALYLASDASRFVTGQEFVVDGGASCERPFKGKAHPVCADGPCLHVWVPLDGIPSEHDRRPSGAQGGPGVLPGTFGPRRERMKPCGSWAETPSSSAGRHRSPGLLHPPIGPCAGDVFWLTLPSFGAIIYRVNAAVVE